MKVKAPILFVAAEKDTLCPADSVRAAVAEAPNAKLSIHDVTHFEIYLGDTLQVRGILVGLLEGGYVLRYEPRVFV